MPILGHDVAVLEMFAGRFVQPVTNETRYEAPVATETEAVTSSSGARNVERFEYQLNVKHTMTRCVVLDW